MARMSATPGRTTARILLCAALMAGGLSACEPTSTAPPDSHLSGDWQLDRSASDDPDASIAKAMNAAESKLRHRLAKYGYGPDQGTGPDYSADAPDYSFDPPGDRYGGPGLVGPDFRGLRARLRQALIPPRALHLDIQDDIVAIGADQLPPRAYRLGEETLRLDEDC